MSIAVGWTNKQFEDSPFEIEMTIFSQLYWLNQIDQ